MFFNSLEQILAQIEQQPGWEEYRKYRQLLECWRKTVNKTTASYTRPLYIKRKVLWVATSSAARAQELSFQRYGLLKQLNAQLSFALKDIHFSASEWEKSQLQGQNSSITVKKRHNSTNNPKFAPKSVNSAYKVESFEDDSATVGTKLTTPQDSQVALKNWLELAKQRSHRLPLCPQCQVPTPQAELNRWHLCHHCVAKKWATEYRPPVFINKD